MFLCFYSKIYVLTTMARISPDVNKNTSSRLPHAVDIAVVESEIGVADFHMVAPICKINLKLVRSEQMQQDNVEVCQNDANWLRRRQSNTVVSVLSHPVVNVWEQVTDWLPFTKM